jgi:hypothetical protein
VYQIFGKLYQQEEDAPPAGDMADGPAESEDGTVNTDYDVQ